MTAPTLGTRTAYASPASDSTSWTVFTGKSVAVGSVLIVAAGDGVTLSTASPGWSLLGQVEEVAPFGSHTCAVFKKTVTSTGDFALSSDDASQYSALLVEVSGGWTVSGTGSLSDNNPPNHNINTVRDVLWIAVVDSDGGAPTADVAPTNYSNLSVSPAAGSGGASINAAFRTVNADSSENPGGFGFPGPDTSEVSWTIALYTGKNRRSGGFL